MNRYDDSIDLRLAELKDVRFDPPDGQRALERRVLRRYVSERGRRRPHGTLALFGTPVTTLTMAATLLLVGLSCIGAAGAYSTLGLGGDTTPSNAGSAGDHVILVDGDDAGTFGRLVAEPEVDRSQYRPVLHDGRTMWVPVNEEPRED